MECTLAVVPAGLPIWGGGGGVGQIKGGLFPYEKSSYRYVNDLHVSSAEQKMVMLNTETYFPFSLLEALRNVTNTLIELYT